MAMLAQEKLITCPRQLAMSSLLLYSQQRIKIFTAVFFLTLRLEKRTTRGIAKPHTKSDYYVTMRSNIKQDEWQKATL